MRVYVPGVSTFLLLAGLSCVGPGRPDAHAQASAPPAAAVDTAHNAEIARLYQEDQADRSPPPTAPRDFFVGMEERDLRRRTRVLEIHNADQLRTGADFYHAAMVLQHGTAPGDYLLAHELSMVAIARGEPRGRWLAAASLDRFLVSIGRPQRFGTQSLFDAAKQEYQLHPVEEGVTDAVRRELGVPALADIRERQEESNRAIKRHLEQQAPRTP